MGKGIQRQGHAEGNLLFERVTEDFLGVLETARGDNALGAGRQIILVDR